MIDHTKTPSDNLTALADASYRVTVTVAEFKADVSLRGSMRTLSWEQAFALAAIGSSFGEVAGSTYTSSRFVFDSAQRISNAWYFKPENIDRALVALERKGLLEKSDNGLRVNLTLEAEKMLLAAGKALEEADES